MKAIKIIAI